MYIVRPWAMVDLQLYDYDLNNMPCKAGHIVYGKLNHVYYSCQGTFTTGAAASRNAG